MHKLARLGIATSIIIGCVTQAFAQASPEKLCIFASVQKLSTIGGIEIISSRTEPPPPDVKYVPGQMAVFINVKLAGMTATYEFACIAGPGQPVAVVPIGMVK